VAPPDLSLAAELVALWAGVFIWWRATGVTTARARAPSLSWRLTALLVRPFHAGAPGPGRLCITALSWLRPLAAYAASTGPAARSEIRGSRAILSRPGALNGAARGPVTVRAC